MKKRSSWIPIIAALLIPPVFVIGAIMIYEKRQADGTFANAAPAYGYLNVVLTVVDGDGAPIANKTAVFVQRQGEEETSYTVTTDSAGIATMSLPKNGTITITAGEGTMQLEGLSTMIAKTMPVKLAISR